MVRSTQKWHTNGVFYKKINKVQFQCSIVYGYKNNKNLWYKKATGTNEQENIIDIDMV